MKNPLAFFSEENFKKVYHILTRRFPLPTLIILILTGLAWYMVATSSDNSTLFRLLVTGGITWILSVAAILFAESRGKNLWIFQGGAILYGIAFFFYYFRGAGWYDDTIVFAFLHGVAFVALIFSAPYFGKKLNTYQYPNYFTKISWILLMTGVVGVALLVLGYIAITAVIELFDLRYSDMDKLYGYWMVFSFICVAPLYGLSQLPRTSDINIKAYDKNVFFSFLLRYIALPFIIIYFVILYAYSIRVLIDFQNWPKGMISWLVIAFSIFGYVIYIFSHSYREENKTFQIFHRYFPMVVIPQIAMLGYAIYLRIMQYDFTMNRYFVVIFGVWLLGVSLYYIFSQKKHLIILPSSISIIALIFSIGPWSVSAFPLARQYDRLMSHLQDANMVSVTGMIMPSTVSVDKKISQEIYSGIEYVCSFEDCNRIKVLFPAQITELEQEQKKYLSEKDSVPVLSQWQIVDKVTTYLGVERYYYRDNSDENPYVYLYRKAKGGTIFPLNIDGYDMLYEISTSNYKPSPYGSFATLSGGLLTLSIDDTEQVFSIEDYQRHLQSLIEEDQKNIGDSDLDLDVENEKYRAKVLFTNYTLPNPKYIGDVANYIEEESVSGYLLIRKK